MPAEIDSRSNSQLPVEEGQPVEARAAVLERLASSSRAEVRRNARLARRLSYLDGQRQLELQEAIGGDRLTQLRRYLADQTDDFARRLEPPDDHPKMTERQRGQLIRNRHQGAASYAREVGLDLEAYSRINRRYAQRMTWPLPRARARRARFELVPGDQVPSDVLEGRGNPWTIKKPPYPGWWWSYNYFVDGFTFDPSRYLDQAAGLVGSSNYLYDSSAGDCDLGNAEHRTGISFWYYMPSTGFLDVWIQGQPGIAQHYLHLKDEWGWSNSWAYQYNYLTFQAVGAQADDVQDSQMSYFWRSDYTSGNWNNTYLSELGTYWAHLNSDSTFPANSWVLIKIGTENHNSCYANDVKVYSEMKFKWFIKSVYVDVK